MVINDDYSSLWNKDPFRKTKLNNSIDKNKLQTLLS